MLVNGLRCPADDLVLDAFDVRGLGDWVGDGTQLTGHAHYASDSVLVCPNGHRWVLTALTLERKP